MYNFLLAVDGSDQALRAVGYLIGLVQRGVLSAQSLGIQLVNVQPRLPEAISFAMSAEQLQAHYHDACAAECRSALSLLVEANLECRLHRRTGSPADQIIACAEEFSCDAIVLGSHGAGLALAALLGSVASRVVDLSEVPVTLVK